MSTSGPGERGADHATPLPPEAVEALAHMPALSAFFRRATQDMPPGLRRVFVREGLTARHGAVLGHLVAAEPMSVTDLARTLGLSLSTVSELVGDLARSGLVRRQEDPANRRRTLVSITPRHRAGVEELLAARNAPLVRAMAGMTRTERAAFLRGLAAWARETRADTR